MELQEKLKSGCAEYVKWASGIFKLLFCICCYFHFTNNSIILSDAMDLPSYANVSSSWNITWPRGILASQGHGTYPSFTLGVKYIDYLNSSEQYKFSDYQAYNSAISSFFRSDDQLGFNFSYMFLDVNGYLQGVSLNLSDFGDSGASSDFDDNWNNTDPFPQCSYPMTCGNYGVCLENDSSCPTGIEGSLNYFRPVNLTPLSSCSGKTKHHDFLELDKFTYFYSTPSFVGTDVMSCRAACVNQCSCKAVIFRYYHHSSFGNCSLPSEILSLIDVSHINLGYQVITFLKVQTNVTSEASSLERNIAIFVSTSLAILVFVIGALCFVLIRAKNTFKKNELSLDISVDNVSRFSFESLKFATQDFQTRVGRGGFGSVYIGTLVDGTQVEVKCLDSCHQGTKEFLAEVNTIGTIHHFNLVKLIGFCDEGSNRLLVYEYMCNGSLDKWIFDDGFCQTLSWNIRKRIIEGVAAGLEYLHEHCHKNVIHFDIKPQNILLDEDFNVRVSDFGLAKMVDQDESQVMTVVKGTPGYMAPELINGRAISVKVDVYSFGMVILELVCGRKNFSSAEEDILTNLLKVKADEDQLCDLIDVRVHDMQQQKEEAVNMIKVAIWCLQPHFIRPTMPKVVKVLQDFSNMEALNDLSDITMAIETNAGEATYNSSFSAADSLLSGPR